METLLKRGRKLDTPNPQRSSLGSDFGRLGFALIPHVTRRRRNATVDLERLDLLVRLRNAIAHGNESAVQSLVADNQMTLTLQSFRRFRKTLDRVVRDMDTVVATELAAGLQIPLPW